MRLAIVVGTLVATIKDDSIKGSKILMIQPVDELGKSVGGVIAAIDTMQVGHGESVFYTLSREAAFALSNDFAPVDAVITGIVDEINTDGGEKIANREKIFV